jgi:hypothetical protein
VIGFGKCGLEIKYPLRETSEEYEDVEESDCSLKIIEDPSSSRGKRTKSPMPSSKLSKKMKINPKESKHEHEKRIVQTHGWFLTIIMHSCYVYFFSMFSIYGLIFLGLAT